MINNKLYQEYLVAQICNDVDNRENYKIMDDCVYYKDELIFTELRITRIDDSIDIYVKPVQPVKYIKGECTIHI